MELMYHKIKLIGGCDFVKKTEEALDYIKRTGEQWLAFVLENIGIIQESTQSGMSVAATPPTFNVGKATYTSSISWYASAIVHDANHSCLYRHGMAYSGRDAERSCMQLQMQFQSEANAPAHEIAHLRRLYETDYDYYSSNQRNW